jgi:hypothetical protein
MEMSKMSTIKIRVKIEIYEEIEIDVDDLMQQSIEDYMDYVRDNPQDYVDIDRGLEWEVA